MRVLALDIGRKRTGIAASDASGAVACPVKVLPSAEVIGCSRAFRRIVDDYDVELIVAGLPVSLDGGRNEHAEWVRASACAIAEALGLPCEFVDERLSTAEAKRAMHAQGLTEKDMRGKLDMVAATLFLQSYLDGRKAREQGE